MLFRCGWHRELVERETANDGIEKQHTAPLVAKSGRHLVGTTLDFSEKSLDDIVGAKRLPVLFGKRVEGQAGVEIALQTLDGRWIDVLILLDEGSHRLIRLCSPFLRKQGFQFRFDLVALFGRNITEHVFHRVHHTALPFGGGECGPDGAQHGLTSVADPQVKLLHPSILEILSEILPGLLILSVPDAEAQDFSLPRRSDPNRRQNRHFAAFPIVDHAEVRSIRKGIAIPLGQWTLLPGLLFRFQGMKDSRNR